MALITKEIDLHGYTVDEAVYRLEQEVVTAYCAGISELLIIYGKGQGVLRQSVLAYLRTSLSKYILEVIPGEKANLQGGIGVAMIIIKGRDEMLSGHRKKPAVLKKIAVTVPAKVIKKVDNELKKKRKARYIRSMERKRK